MTKTGERLNYLGTEFIFGEDEWYVSSTVLSEPTGVDFYKKPFEGEFKEINFLKLFETAFILSRKLHLSSGFVKRYLDIYDEKIAEALIEDNRDKIEEITGSEELTDYFFNRYKSMHTFTHEEGDNIVGITSKHSEKYFAKLLFLNKKERMRTMISLNEINLLSFIEALLKYSKFSAAVMIREKNPNFTERYAVITKDGEFLATFSNGKTKEIDKSIIFEISSSLEIFFNRIKYQGVFDLKPLKTQGIVLRNTSEGTQMIGLNPEWLAPLVPVSIKLYGLIKNCG